MRVTKHKTRTTLWFNEAGSHITFERGANLSKKLGFWLEVDTEDVTLGLFLFLKDFFISLDSRTISNFLRKHPNHFFKATWKKGSPMSSYWEERNIALRLDFSDFIFSGEFWTNMDNNPRNRYFYWDLADIFLGRAKYREETLATTEQTIDMPEGIYKVTVRKFRSYWKRPRWFFTQTIDRLDVKIPKGLPFEGKGENSWDMGMDATYEATMPIEDGGIRATLDRLALSILKRRQRYGNLSDKEYKKWFKKKAKA